MKHLCTRTVPSHRLESRPLFRHKQVPGWLRVSGLHASLAPWAVPGRSSMHGRQTRSETQSSAGQASRCRPVSEHRERRSRYPVAILSMFRSIWMLLGRAPTQKQRKRKRPDRHKSESKVLLRIGCWRVNMRVCVRACLSTFLSVCLFACMYVGHQHLLCTCPAPCSQSTVERWFCECLAVIRYTILKHLVNCSPKPGYVQQHTWSIAAEQLVTHDKTQVFITATTTLSSREKKSADALVSPPGNLFVFILCRHTAWIKASNHLGRNLCLAPETICSGQ